MRRYRIRGSITRSPSRSLAPTPSLRPHPRRSRPELSPPALTSSTPVPTSPTPTTPSLLLLGMWTTSSGGARRRRSRRRRRRRRRRGGWRRRGSGARRRPRGAGSSRCARRGRAIGARASPLARRPRSKQAASSCARLRPRRSSTQPCHRATGRAGRRAPLPWRPTAWPRLTAALRDLGRARLERARTRPRLSPARHGRSLARSTRVAFSGLAPC